ncbi:MAG: hypothetical protein QM766_04085 [Burkholderiaceae bacterium]
MLRGILREADAGVRHADQLVRVYRKRGGPAWVYVHVEVQATRKADFERRMFTYSYLLFERFGRPVASLVVLADPHRGWRPHGYGFELFGSRLCSSFPTVKLLDYEAAIARVESGSAADIDRWARRVLDAASLDEALSGDA